MELSDLALFQEAVRQGNISRAARLMHMTQPTASRRLKRLEAAIGAILLDRHGPSVSPTRAGLAVLRFAASVLPQSERLEGDLEIAASTMPGESFVPGLLAQFARLHPGLRARLHVMDSQGVENCVVDKTCDLGFVGQPPKPGLLSFHPIGEDEIVLAVPAGHPYFDQTEVPPETLGSQAFVEREPGSATRRTAEEGLRAAGIDCAARRIVLVASSTQAILSAVRSGVGVGFVSAAALKGFPTDEVQGLRIRGIRLRRRIYLLHLPQAKPAATSFVAFALAARSGCETE